MFQQITHPTTGAQFEGFVFEIGYADACRTLGRDHGVKALSLTLLQQVPARREAGEGFALRTFEQGLDWELGICALNYILCLKAGTDKRRPKVLRIAVDRRGNCFVVSPNGVVRFDNSLPQQ